MSESDKWRPQLIAHRFAETASSQHWIGHRFPPSPDPSQRFILWLAGFFADSIWIYQSWQESSQVLRAIYTTARGSCIWLAGRILCASKSNVVAAMIWIGMHARARF